MRAILTAVLLTLGAAPMTADQVQADDKKEPETKVPDPSQPGSYTEKISLRVFENGKLVANPLPNVPAFRFEKDGAMKFYTQNKGIRVTAGSEITDKDGKVYTVEKVVNYKANGYDLSTVKPKK